MTDFTEEDTPPAPHALSGVTCSTCKTESCPDCGVPLARSVDNPLGPYQWHMVYGFAGLGALLLIVLIVTDHWWYAWFGLFLIVIAMLGPRVAKYALGVTGDGGFTLSGER